jgi:hypothetical protein
MSERNYELIYNAADPDRECGWYWRHWLAPGPGRIECGPFDTVDAARADAEGYLTA